MDEIPIWAVRLKAERERRGWSKYEMARQLHKAVNEEYPPLESLARQIRGWENGRHCPGGHWQDGYATVFNLSKTEIFGSPDQVNGDEDVDRREFVGFTLSAAGLALAGPRPAAGASHSRVSAGTIRRLRQRTARLRRLDEVLGGADTYPLYARELAQTLRMVDDDSYTQETGRALLGVVAEQSQQAGWAAFDAGHHPVARRLFKQSLSAASDAGDPSLIAASLAFIAYQKSSTGQLATGEADAACRVADSEQTPGPVRALVFERAAWAHAVVGRSAEAEKALERAGNALQGGQGEPTPDWAAWVDSIELQIMEGRCWSALGKPKRAIPILRGALDHYDDAHARDKGLYLTWLADAHLDAGDVEKAATVTSRSLDLVADVSSVRPKARIAKLVGRLQPHRSLSAVSDLIEESEWVFSRSPGSPSPGMPPTLLEG